MNIFNSSQNIEKINNFEQIDHVIKIVLQGYSQG